MDVGESLLILGNRCLGAGANVTADSFRSVVVTLFCKGGSLDQQPDDQRTSKISQVQGNELRARIMGSGSG
jgi:hypothetical protein